MSAWVTASGARFMLLHSQRNEDSVRSFFIDVYELYTRALLNPFLNDGEVISAPWFEAGVRQLGRKIR